MPSLNHVHIYRRVRREKKLWMCGDPNCSHTQKKALLEGKLTRCNNCTNEFVLTPQDLKRSRPLCMDCRNTKEARDFREKKSKVENILEQIFGKDLDESTTTK